MNRYLVVSARMRSPGARFTGARPPAITRAMKEDVLIACPSCLPPSRAVGTVADWPVEPRLACPLGRATRLIPVSRRDGLVECRPAQAGHCPNFMSFGGGFFCRAHLGVAAEDGPRQP